MWRNVTAEKTINNSQEKRREANLPLPVSEIHTEPRTGLSYCQRKRNEYVSAMHILTIMDSVTTLLLPLVCVTAMLVAIALSIIHTYRWRRSSPGSQKHRAELMRIPQVRVAKMLFALSLSFVVMNSPSHVCRLYYMMATRGGGFVARGGGGGGGGEVSLTGEELDEFINGSRAEGKQVRDDVLMESESPVVSPEEGLVQLVLLYGSYCYYAVKFLLFLSFSKNFRRSIRETCTDTFAPPCVKRAAAPVAV